MEDKEELAKITKRIPSCFFKIPINALSVQTKEYLKYLDCCFIIPDNLVKLRDYRGLAILLGYSQLEINYLIDQKKYTSPTYLILEKMNLEKKSMGDLIFYLLRLKRSDILANIKDSCNADVDNYLNKTDRTKKELVNYEAVKEWTSKAEIEEAHQTIKKLFTTDIIKEKDKVIDIYDIFISFDSESISDIKVMWQLSNIFEANGLTVAKGSYSFFQGCCLIEAFANAIYNRSRKVILLISETFIKSESCLMQLNFAKDSDKASSRHKVIPMYIDKVRKPDCIANLNSFLYYDSFCRENFMKNFIQNIKEK